MPVWVLMIDLRKAFDRVDHKALFHSLRQQMDSDYVNLLEKLYKRQYGNVGKHKFLITRGVRQGDILSPLLFNAVLEHAMRKWKRKFRSHGFQLHQKGNDLIRNQCLIKLQGVFQLEDGKHGEVI